ncbi:hypothetical protein Clacol_005237 [Clathrus columnatus]|uniref:50S ribosomal protein L13 n=1 Tax=Clathrus columnatus TaxID=1419009 RepID=A0AAV5AEB0_9AGAM|nr:hypothetical protein Clacol_005237 [Clathrus columnatus]
MSTPVLQQHVIQTEARIILIFLGGGENSKFSISSRLPFPFISFQINRWSCRKQLAILPWYHVDASGRILGKLAHRIVIVLMGKHESTYDPSTDCGDYVVVTNASKIQVTGRKEEQKPDEIIRKAIAGMLPKKKLLDRRLECLRIFADDDMDMGPLGKNLLQG